MTISHYRILDKLGHGSFVFNLGHVRSTGFDLEVNARLAPGLLGNLAYWTGGDVYVASTASERAQVAKALIEQRMGGDVIYISSKNSVFAGPNNIAYSATKADQAHQVRLLAVELGEHGVRVRYLHADIETVERVEIIRDLRLGAFDVLVGINLLREGLDLPEVSLVCILDADKEGFLRSETSLVQMIGRAARNVDGQVIMYADSITPSTGTRSPGRTTTTSPARTSPTGRSRSSPSRTTRAAAGWRRTSARSAAAVLRLARASNALPVRISAMMMITAS